MPSIPTTYREALWLLFAGACLAVPLDEAHATLGYQQLTLNKLQRDENEYQPHGQHLPVPPLIPVPFAVRDVISFNENEAGNYSSPSRNYVLLGFLALFFVLIAVFGIPSHYRQRRIEEEEKRRNADDEKFGYDRETQIGFWCDMKRLCVYVRQTPRRLVLLFKERHARKLKGIKEVEKDHGADAQKFAAVESAPSMKSHDGDAEDMDEVDLTEAVLLDLGKIAKRVAENKAAVVSRP